ncbi:hypothetical protein [Chitinophaga niabensis]|uniref:hypothetical protein n=1 Tax=Chitinophaga niabensis TaxID=536979 RepID=UPI0009412C97|nr:hypothetical protein [Chitinophaga niabensis]
MAKQTGPVKITGTIENICFYKMGDGYYVRLKSSLTGKRVKKDPRFKRTMEFASFLSTASKIASEIYCIMPKQRGLYRRIVGMAMQLLKLGIEREETMLQLQEILAAASLKETAAQLNETAAQLEGPAAQLEKSAAQLEGPAAQLEEPAAPLEPEQGPAKLHRRPGNIGHHNQEHDQCENKPGPELNCRKQHFSRPLFSCIAYYHSYEHRKRMPQRKKGNARISGDTFHVMI